MTTSEPVCTHSIFEEPWWLDATAPGQWDAVAIEEGGRTVARLPFVMKRRHGLRVLGQPDLAQSLGPWVDHGSDVTSKRLSREKNLFTQLIRKLPQHDVFHQNFHSNVTNWLPFYWQGFEQTTRYSYVIDDLQDLEMVFASMDKATRYEVKKAQKSITVLESDGVDEVLSMTHKTFERQGLAMPYEPETLYRIDEAAKQHGHRRAIYGVDDDGNVHSAAYIVGDERRAYLLISGADPELRQSGSGNLVHWAAIRAASSFAQVFDFEGSVIEPIEAFYRGFGTRQSPYHSITGYSKRATRLDALRRLVRGR